MTRLHKTRAYSTMRRSRLNKYSYKRDSLSTNCSEDTTQCSTKSSECQRLIGYPEASKEKWVALSLYCALAFTQSYIWNTWSPITESVQVAFPSWTKASISLLSNWGCISYLICSIPCCWILYKQGLVCPIRTAAFLTMLATFLRCIFSEELSFTIAVHIAAILNGVSGVILGSATALVSAVWFPTGQRTTATGISYAVNQMGVALSYVISPSLLTDVYYAETHQDKFEIQNSSDLHLFQIYLRNEITSLMRIEFVIQMLLFCGVIWLYPKNEPFHRPSTTSYKDTGLFKSITELAKIKSVWLLCWAIALSQGTMSPWLNTLTFVFKSIMTQNEADNLAMWAIIVSSILTLVLSRIMDLFQGHLKNAINLMLVLSALMFAWIILMDNNFLTFHKSELYVAIILGISICWATSALFLELISEIAFPISEAIVGGYMVFFINIVGCIFYELQFISKMGEIWFTNCVLVNLILSTLLIFYVKDEYNRSRLDVFENTCVTLFDNQKKFTLLNNSYRQILFHENNAPINDEPSNKSFTSQ